MNYLITPMKNLIVRSAALFRANKYKVLLTAAVVVLAAANFSLLARPVSRPVQVQAEAEMAEAAIAKETADIKPIAQEIAGQPAKTDSVPLNLVHANCIAKLLYETQPSTVYKPNPNDLSFVYGTNSNPAASLNGFYDINGDNLPDYVYTRNWTAAGAQDIDTHLETCIYLHNGTGWTKSYVCMATTRVNRETGETTIAQYYGDCAQF